MSGSATNRDAKTQLVIDRLKKVYKEKLMPFESLYLFDKFHSPLMLDAEFDSVPQVLMIGQYSVGKTSFIEYLLGRSFPGQRVGPEPTTDRFVAVVHGPEERIIPGNAVAVQKGSAFTGLQRFGTAFLNKFEAAQVPCPVLQNMMLIDTPGILAGEKQRLTRGYDFDTVCRWFAVRSDLILLIFDAHKLDISDEFRRVIEGLKGQDDKIRCVMNKADQIDEQRLMRVYGALMWSMGKVMGTPEVLRVYVGSFWDQPLTFESNAALFEKEESDLMTDFRHLPRNSAVRKINELVKRIRLAIVHAHLIGYLKAQMPTMMGKASKQKELIADLPTVCKSPCKLICMRE
jgi:GTPase SAR1 family protein